MAYQQFIMIRFSLAFEGRNMKPIHITLNEKRLKEKFALFEKICLPSLLKQQHKKNILVIVKITNNLPQHWKDKLHKLVDPYPSYIKIQEFDYQSGSYGDSLSNKHLVKYIKPKTKFILTTRIDDDDALRPNFTKLVRRYIKRKNVNKIVSFTRGYVLDTRSKRFYPSNKKLLALGLTLIQLKGRYKRFPSGVFNGCHTQWEKKAKCIYDKKNVMYIRTRSGANDSKLNRKTRLLLKKGNRNLKVLRRQFPKIKI